MLSVLLLRDLSSNRNFIQALRSNKIRLEKKSDKNVLSNIKKGVIIKYL